MGTDHSARAVRPKGAKGGKFLHILQLNSIKQCLSWSKSNIILFWHVLENKLEKWFSASELTYEISKL